MPRTTFSFSEEACAALERIRKQTRRESAASVIRLALEVLWDCVMHRMSGGKIIITDKNGVQREYDPLYETPSDTTK